jgi:hypothetical protein
VLLLLLLLPSWYSLLLVALLRGVNGARELVGLAAAEGIPVASAPAARQSMVLVKGHGMHALALASTA